jgi:cyanophycin synthetase
MLRQALLDSGVEDQQVRIVIDEQAAVQSALAEARVGDLVMVFGDAIRRCWKQIIYFKPGADVSLPPAMEHERAGPAPLEMEGEAFEPAAEIELLRDERGVMLAPDPEDSD